MSTAAPGEPPLLSVVTPSFNQAPFLAETIQSVIGQERTAIDYLVIDGGSTDGSRGVIEQHANRLAYWCSEADSGQAQAINKGFRRATANIWAWLNSDDTYRPGAAASAVEYLQRHPEVDVVYGDVDFVDAAGGWLTTMRAWNFDARLLVCATNLIPQPAAFFRRHACEQVGGLDESLQLVIDYDLWVRMALKGMTFQHVPEVWATYRLHPASKTSSQVLGFSAEMRRVIDRAFQDGAPPAWRRQAESNYEQFQAEAYLKNGQTAEARRHFMRAARMLPLRPKSLALLASAVHPRLGRLMRRLRWRLAGRTDEPWQPLLPV